MIDHSDNDIALRAACRTNDTQEALRLLGEGADPLFNAGSAVLWSARHENLDLLDAFEPLCLKSDPGIFSQILVACVDKSIFVERYNLWKDHLTSIQCFELVYAAIKHKHETHAHYLLDNLPVLTKHQQQEIVNRAADGCWSVFDRVVAQLDTQLPLLGTVGLLVRHQQLGRLKTIAPLIAWSNEHQHDIGTAYIQSQDAYNIIRPFIGQWGSCCEPILRWALHKDVDAFNQALYEVTDPTAQCNVLQHLLRRKSSAHIEILFEHTPYTVLATHLNAANNVSDEMKRYFEEQYSSKQHKILSKAVHAEDYQPQRARVSKL